jgi:hypothetical protein
VRESLRKRGWIEQFYKCFEQPPVKPDLKNTEPADDSSSDSDGDENTYDGDGNLIDGMMHVLSCKSLFTCNT